jgi:di/tricarboxylate transporter
MKTTLPVALIVVGLLAFLGVMFWLKVISAPALAVSVTTTLLGWVTQSPTNKKTGGSILPPPPLDDVAPVSIPKNDAPKVDQ